MLGTVEQSAVRAVKWHSRASEFLEPQQRDAFEQDVQKYARVESSSAPTSCEVRQSTAAAGLGTFASRDLTAGEILYAELPFLVAKTHAINDGITDSGTALLPSVKLRDLSAISIQQKGYIRASSLGPCNPQVRWIFLCDQLRFNESNRLWEVEHFKCHVPAYTTTPNKKRRLLVIARFNEM